MQRFRAEVVFTFEASGIEAGGRRLHELSNAAQAVGFELRSAEVHPDEHEGGDDAGWTPFAPG